MGISNLSRWIGKGKGQIHVRKSGDMTKLTLGDVTMTVPTEFYEAKREVIEQYHSKERFFESMYWGTTTGRADMEERYRENFHEALERRFERANPQLVELAQSIWDNMSPWQRDRFTGIHGVLVESVFKYEEEQVKGIDPGFDYYENSRQQDAELRLLIDKLRNF